MTMNKQVSLTEAQERKICRICGHTIEIIAPGNPLILNHGKDHAHEMCLALEKEREEKTKGAEVLAQFVERCSKLESCLNDLSLERRIQDDALKSRIDLLRNIRDELYFFVSYFKLSAIFERDRLSDRAMKLLNEVYKITGVGE